MADRHKTIIEGIIDDADYTYACDNWHGRGNETVTVYVRGRDVVLVNMSDEYVTVMKMARPTNASPVEGLNSIHDIEDERFVAFFNIVQDAAREDGQVFLLNCGEGNDEFLDDMDVCDLSGWLSRREELGEFEPIWRDGNAWESDELDSRFAFARWSMGEDGNVTIRFEAA